MVVSLTPFVECIMHFWWSEFVAWDLSHSCFGANYAAELKKLRAEFMAIGKALFHPVTRRGWRGMFWQLVKAYEDKMRPLPLEFGTESCPISVIFSELSRGLKKLLRNASPD